MRAHAPSKASQETADRLSDALCVLPELQKLFDVVSEKIRSVYGETDAGYYKSLEAGAQEYDRIFRPLGYSASYDETDLGVAARVLSQLRLRDGDVFADVGSGTGKLVAACRLLFPGVRCVGVELSEKRHAVATAAAAELQVADGVALMQGSMLDVSLSAVTVAYFAVRPQGRTAELLHDLVRKLLRERPAGSRTRLVSVAAAVETSEFGSGSVVLQRAWAADVFPFSAAKCRGRREKVVAEYILTSPIRD
eukprot:TRINITY_DN10831_c0_g1_i3.p1 TRINITY_DN10831_c0_g1~~TRINITY_DN10831_c0_g1_i3.p1  ORF type:complete len:251 (+),score=47.87 TRINITY_DN10831_c0_g1_i3:52-804(+)